MKVANGRMQNAGIEQKVAKGAKGEDGGVVRRSANREIREKKSEEGGGSLT